MRPVAQRSSTFHRPLDAMLGTVANVRVLRVLAEHGGALAATTIATRARISRQSAWNAIARLSELGVVETFGEPRGTLFRISPAHPLVPAIRALFQTETQRVERLFACCEKPAGQTPTTAGTKTMLQQQHLSRVVENDRARRDGEPCVRGAHTPASKSRR